MCIRDRINIRRCPGRCPQNVVANLYEATVSECSELAAICLPISLDNILDFDILVDGSPYTEGLQGCAVITSLSYTYFTIPDQGAKGPYQITSWIVNGTNNTGTFNNLDELLAWMNDKDPTGGWVIDSSTLSIRGGESTTTYGKLEIVQSLTRSKASLDVNTKSSPDGTQLRFAVGAYSVQMFNTVSGCSDTFEVIVDCITGLAPDATSDIVEAPSSTETGIDLSLIHI